MTFAIPFAIKVRRTCRVCGRGVLVFLLNGATVPRDPYFTGGCCLGRLEATDARLDALAAHERRAQLQLVQRTEG